MENLSTGAGLGAMGFWLFVAAIVAAGVWDNIRKLDAQHETLRRVIESGQTLDEAMTDKLLSVAGSNKELDRDLRVAGLILLALAPGLAVFGWLLSIATGAAKLMPIMLAVGVLMLFISAGLLGAAWYIRRWDNPKFTSNVS